MTRGLINTRYKNAGKISVFGRNTPGNFIGVAYIFNKTLSVFGRKTI